MSCNNGCPVSDPILSSQVTDVDLRMPKCMDTCDNSLNGWLKWLAEKQCECDWENFNLEPLQPLLNQVPCDITLCTIVDSIVEAIETLNTNQETCCEETEYSVPENDWTVVEPIKALRKGRMITLTGTMRATTSYTDTIATLPSAIVPSGIKRFPIAHNFAPSATYNVFLRISSSGEIDLYFTGVAPAYSSEYLIYLDGVTFFIN